MKFALWVFKWVLRAIVDFIDSFYPLARVFRPINLFLFFCACSFIVNITLLRFLKKSPSIQTDLYFDFSHERPISQLCLLTAENQWGYEIFLSSVKSHPKNLLLANKFYRVSVEFYLPRSPRNFQILKFMAVLRIKSASGAVIASSTRPVVQRYRSPLVSWIDILAKWPLYVFNIYSEQEKVSVVFMENYRENSNRQNGSAIIETVLSTSDIDVDQVKLQITPHLSGIS